MQSRLVALAALAFLAPAVWAQEAKVGSTEVETAMERAQRAAAGPLKAIQQVAKIRRRGEGVLGSAPAAALVAASAAAAPEPAPMGASVLNEPPVVDVLLELGAGVLGGPLPTEGTPIASEPLAAATAKALPPTRVLEQPLLDALPTQPQVLDRVEPSIPPALLAQGPSAAEIAADLSLRADGSVAGVSLLPPVPLAWQQHIVAALERWRFESMSGPRSHRVRLVVGAPAER